MPVAGTEKKEKNGFSRSLHWHTRVQHFQIRFFHSLKEVSGYRVVRLFRNYSAFSIVASSAFVVSASNLAEGQDTESLLFGYVNNEIPTATELSSRKSEGGGNEAEANLSMVPLANALPSIDPGQKDEISLFDVEKGGMESSILLSTTQVSNIAKDPEEEGGVKIYTVQSGDTVSTIATAHNITTNTILWANDIDDVDEIKPGDQLFILPVAGLSHTVKEGETLDKIATEYKAEKDKIIAFNELPANGEIETGDTIVIPNGQKEVPVPAVPEGGLDRRQYATSAGGVATDISTGFRDLTGKAGTGHRFPYGYCTWYVASKRYVPWGGNAGTWLYNAKAQGYKTGKTPRPGAIIVTTENVYYGHVALVEKVSGNTITVTEMNYTGWGKTSRRTLSASSRVIKGYIY